MRRRARLGPGLLLAMVLTGCQEPADFVDVNGQGHRYADFSGRYLVLNYWATWCGPCIKEIPELNKLAVEQVDKLVVLGVNFDEPEGEEAVKQMRKMNIEFPVYAAGPHVRLGIEVPEVLPTTFIFSPDLEVVDVLVGPQTDESILAVIDRRGDR